LKKYRFRLAKTKEIPQGKCKTLLLPDGRERALFHRDGSFFALDNACPHEGGPLGEGEVSDGIVTCPWHGWTFDLKTGNCLNMPGEDAIAYPIEIVDGEIYILLSDEDL
jgi:nitrite reductase (NADH) small subunit